MLSSINSRRSAVKAKQLALIPEVNNISVCCIRWSPSDNVSDLLVFALMCQVSCSKNITECHLVLATFVTFESHVILTVDRKRFSEFPLTIIMLSTVFQGLFTPGEWRHVDIRCKITKITSGNVYSSMEYSFPLFVARYEHTEALKVLGSLSRTFSSPSLRAAFCRA